MLEKAIDFILFRGNYILEKNVELLSEIAKYCSKPLYFISSRPNRYRDISILELNKWFSDIEYKLILSDTKHLVVNSLGINIFVEDGDNYIEDLTNHTKCIILIYDKPWNRHLKDIERTKRVRDWKGILKFVEGM